MWRQVLNIIFDLDGTLIDSSEGILKAVQLAFEQCGVVMQQPLSSKLIGPPLTELLVILAGTKDSETLNRLSISFKENYDTEGYKDTTIFDGVVSLMQELKNKHHTLYIATNKRILPTRKIIEFFRWDNLFDGVYALDLFSHTQNKTDLITHIMQLHNMNKTSTLYIGDTLGDHKAARSNDIFYLMAMWGYDSEAFTGGNSVDSPALVLEKIKRYEPKLE